MFPSINASEVLIFTTSLCVPSVNSSVLYYDSSWGLWKINIWHNLYYTCMSRADSLNILSGTHLRTCLANALCSRPCEHTGDHVVIYIYLYKICFNTHTSTYIYNIYVNIYIYHHIKSLVVPQTLCPFEIVGQQKSSVQYFLHLRDLSFA